jgi:NADH-quinone oxidoreductase subunit M
MASYLLASLALPLLGAAWIWPAAALGRNAVRWVALAASLLTLAVAGYLVYAFPTGTPEAANYAAVSFTWLEGLSGVDLRFSVGLDGLSIWLYGLSALLSLTAVLVSWNAVEEEAAAYYALLLILETGMLGVFAARDVILFYVFFEFTLIPLFFLIGVWGSEDRRYAAVKFFLYTFAGSVLTFLGLLAISFWHYQHQPPGGRVLIFSIPELTAWLSDQTMDLRVQLLIFLALFAGFAIKVPLFPLHTWLPLAHTQAPTAGSVLLAGVLLKIGAYGFVRFNLTMLPEATAACMPWILALSTAGILYGALVALAQTDIKRLIAYSSVSHLGFCMLGLFALDRLGVSGGIIQMLTHGLATGGLFACVGMLYERYHTREIAAYSGMARRLPILSFFFLVLTLASIGLPGLGGFAGEFMLLAGMFQRAFAQAPPQIAWHLQAMSVLAVLGVVLGAWYMLWLVQRVFFGPLHEPAHHEGPPIRDLSLREIAALAPLVLGSLWIGLYPQFFLRHFEPVAARITSRVTIASQVDPNVPAAAARVAQPSGPRPEELAHD